MMANGSRPQLCGSTLATLPKAVARPAYDRSALTAGIVHLGIGAFHRAHQAVTVDDVLAADPTGRSSPRASEAGDPRRAEAAGWL